MIVLQIGDFGLARAMLTGSMDIDSSIYYRSQHGVMPLKWSALEVNVNDLTIHK